MAKLFIVDDEPTFQEAVKPFFELKGFTVLASMSGEEALPQIEAEKPDVVILDMHLSGRIDGMGVLRQIREKKIPASVIMLTGMENNIKDEVLSLGADKFLNKPVTVKALNAAIEELLKK